VTESEAPRPWRCFVAVPLPDDLREALRAWVAEVRRGASFDADWRWADPQGWHITLVFLGATSPDAVAGILEDIAGAAADATPFSVTAGGLGGFPGGRRARVLWCGIKDEEHRLEELAAAVGAATGTDETSPFRPHVTLARARNRRGADIPNLATETMPSGPVPVSVIYLAQSHLGHGPAQYETLGEVALSTPVGVGAPT
jgi:RNA 2',3'-cyclic 3'-phosphodiesterase